MFWTNWMDIRKDLYTNSLLMWRSRHQATFSIWNTAEKGGEGGREGALNTKTDSMKNVPESITKGLKWPNTGMRNSTFLPHSCVPQCEGLLCQTLFQLISVRVLTRGSLSRRAADRWCYGGRSDSTARVVTTAA